MNIRVTHWVFGWLIIGLGACWFGPVRAATRAPDIEALNEWLEAEFDAAAYPGLSVVLVHGDRIAYARGFGKESTAGEKLMTADSVSAIGSLTKSFTALCLIRLVEADKVDLDHPVTHYLPWFRTADKAASDDITVRMLLSNTSGLPSLDVGILDRSEATDADERLARSLAGHLLNRPPGSGFEYANEGFVLAGLIAATVHGKPYPESLADLVLSPLGMVRSSSLPAQVAALGGLTGHYTGLLEGVPARQGLTSMQYAAAGSILQCSARDLGRYMSALLGGGDSQGRPYLELTHRDEMWRSHIHMPESERMGPLDYGLGWMVGEVDGRRIAAHGGHAMTMTSFAMLVPEQNLGIAILSNIDTLDSYRFPDLMTLANNGLHVAMDEPLSDFGKPKRADKTRNDFTLPDERAAALPGVYRAGGLAGLRLRISQREDGRLFAVAERAGQIIKEGLFDFMNPARGYVRGIGQHAAVYVQASSDGTVPALIYGGTKLYREAPDKAAANRFVAERDRFRVELGEGWQEKGGEDVHAAKGDRTLWVGFSAGEADARQALEIAAGIDAARIEWGPEYGVTIGDLYWRKSSARAVGDASHRQFAIVSHRLAEGTLHVVLGCAAGDLTRMMQEDGLDILKSLAIRHR
ncbi:Beta-lactamase family protein [Sulfidibacter corallicola]|uniref:Beta-lactamase family protein n=1 Tax=Sulfidibacter corallicola TaxID=2818388 RepID=A0A8A4TS86_SULCO|nr:serine hydrolase domain-containing protein [Sulfidibacter corallicola]QTD52826.1 beta-lactamase family protein [Sulfidibacter corallicola]